ncbi:hypothetical protein L596_025445 [Steinernema carpocapsae]|uniref:Uncharacterized protein n=1 Tax=Steinernema carpocapsae TaxID=34508 RepID=A0A4U5M7T3_STECR|nr:hypothetical protein L596_025445 [Steinernema carpocapsae]
MKTVFNYPLFKVHNASDGDPPLELLINDSPKGSFDFWSLRPRRAKSNLIPIRCFPATIWDILNRRRALQLRNDVAHRRSLWGTKSAQRRGEKRHRRSFDELGDQETRDLTD